VPSNPSRTFSLLMSTTTRSTLTTLTPLPSTGRHHFSLTSRKPFAPSLPLSHKPRTHSHRSRSPLPSSPLHLVVSATATPPQRPYPLSPFHSFAHFGLRPQESLSQVAPQSRYHLPSPSHFTPGNPHPSSSLPPSDCTSPPSGKPPFNPPLQPIPQHPLPTSHGPSPSLGFHGHSTSPTRNPHSPQLLPQPLSIPKLPFTRFSHLSLASPSTVCLGNTPIIASHQTCSASSFNATFASPSYPLLWPPQNAHAAPAQFSIPLVTTSLAAALPLRPPLTMPSATPFSTSSRHWAPFLGYHALPTTWSSSLLAWHPPVPVLSAQRMLVSLWHLHNLP
jgi:hypothetical protein